MRLISKLKNFYYTQIDCRLNPRQKWLTKVIPKTWCDKTELIPRILFASLIDFVEEEGGLNQLNVDWTDELKAGHVTQSYIDKINSDYGELANVYQYVKNERAILQKQYDNSFPEIDYTKTMSIQEMFARLSVPSGKSYEEVYGETDRIEKLIDEKDLWAMQTIVKHYQILWT